MRWFLTHPISFPYGGDVEGAAKGLAGILAPVSWRGEGQGVDVLGRLLWNVHKMNQAEEKTTGSGRQARGHTGTQMRLAGAGGRPWWRGAFCQGLTA